MTPKELWTSLRKLEEEKQRILKQTEKDFKKKNDDLLNAWAQEHARFKPGDVICSKDGDNYNCERGTYLRIETVTTDLSDAAHSPFVRYSGQLLLPDLTRNSTRSKYSIRDYGDNEIIRLSRPEFVSFVVTDESGEKEFSAKTYLGTLGNVRYVCNQLELNAKTYGILPNGERVLLLKTPTLAKYFKNH